MPLVDLRAQAAEVDGEIAAGWSKVVADCSFILGEEVGAFEEEYAEYIGVRSCVGVANGTDALELSLRALGIGPGDEVVLPANSFVASALAVHRAGATPVLADCLPDTLLIDPNHVSTLVGPRTAAIMPVHLYGQMSPMAAIESIAKRHSLAIVEDAAQAQGARQNGRSAGAVGAISGTSFYPGKNLGAYGDAGAILTDDAVLAERARALRNNGGETRYQHDIIGFNSRLDTLQAVVLRAKLKRLDQWNGARQAAAARYRSLLDGTPNVTLPVELEGNEHVWHLYVVRVPDRDRVLRLLNDAGIGAAVHYPRPIHLLPAFSHLDRPRGSFPVAELAGEEILSLPMHPHLSPSDQERIADVLTTAVA